jgi:hypothetical protein
MGSVHNILVGKPEVMRKLLIHRHRSEDCIDIDLEEIGCEGLDWIHLAQDRVK